MACNCECACCKPQFAVQVLETWQETPTIPVVRIAKPDPFHFRAGQYAQLKLKLQPSTLGGPSPVAGRMLSMASSPTRPYLEFAVRMSGSSFKRTFQQLQVGDEVLISGPAGSFVIDPAEHLVLLSGGVGITPLKSIAEYAADLRLPMRLTLLYSNRDTSEMAYAQALAELAGRNPLFRVIHTLTREPGTCWSGQRGRVDAALIQQHVVDLDRAVFFLCGPPGLVRGLHATLNELGVTDERIRSEDFTGY